MTHPIAETLLWLFVINLGIAFGVYGEIARGPMAQLPLVLIPGFLVPFFVMLHLTALFQARRLTVSGHSGERA